MGMMKMIGNVGRKFRTAYMKTSRRKTTMPKSMSEDWRARNRAGDPEAGNEFKQHMRDAEHYVKNRPAPKPVKKKMDAVIPSKSSKTRITFKGQDMQERNFFKSHKMVGGIRYGTIVSKEAYRTGGKKAVADSYGSKGFKNYKTRSYQP